MAMAMKMRAQMQVACDIQGLCISIGARHVKNKARIVATYASICAGDMPPNPGKPRDRIAKQVVEAAGSDDWHYILVAVSAPSKSGSN